MTNVLDRITTLREERNWSEYQLADRSGLTQSTISSWYRKGMLPSIPSLEKICNAFQITLSQFFNEEELTVTLTPDQLEMISEYNRLNDTQRKNLIHFLKSL